VLPFPKDWSRARCARAFDWARLALALFLVLAPLWPAVCNQRGPRVRLPDITGTWYMNGDRNCPCEVLQPRPHGDVEFINENGSRAWGVVRGDRVWIPQWNDGTKQGLQGVIWGKKIVWPDGNCWSR
jgi:hypothetical protein